MGQPRMAMAPWMGADQNYDRDQIIESVTAELLRMMERRRMIAVRDVADEAASGNVRSVYKLLSREKGNLALVQRVIHAYPEIGRAIGEPVVCDRCGRLPIVRG